MDRSMGRLPVLLCAVVTLAGMGWSGTAGLAAPAPAAPASLTPAGGRPCAWPLVTDPSRLNVAAPDYNATYWTMPILYSDPGMEILVDGVYPSARFMSIQTYDHNGNPIDYIADDLIPATGGKDPFSDPTADPTAINTFEAAISPSAPVGEGGSATLRGLPESDQTGQGLGFIVYRVYLGNGDRAGGEPLPTLTIKRPGLPPAVLPPCARTTPRASSPLPAGLSGGQGPLPAGQGPLAGPGSGSPPAGADLPWTAANEENSGSLFPNNYNGYMGLDLQAATYDPNVLLVIHGKAPTAPDTRDNQPAATPGLDMRYWSLSTYNWRFSKPVIQTAADYTAAKDAAGYYTFVIDRPLDKPPDPVLSRWHATWVNWGSGNDHLVVVLRNLLPAEDFAYAIPKQQPGQPPLTDQDMRNAMKEYYPEARFCDKSAFVSGGAAACF